MTQAILLLSFVTVSRLAELWLSRSNTQKLLDQGAAEFAPGHYPFIVALHAAWLAGLWLAAGEATLNTGWLAVFAALQMLRGWVLLTLGPRWTTRIIILPDRPLVASGPYRFLRHPNYAVVIGEIAVLPLCLGMPLYALVFSAANALLLTIRIRAENAALGEVRNVGENARAAK